MTRDDLLAFYVAAFDVGAKTHGVMNPPGHEGKYKVHHSPLTPELIRGSLSGASRRLTGRSVPLSLAGVLTSPEGTARAFAIDVDRGGAAAVAQVLAVCQEYGLWAFAQLGASTGDTEHDGGHVWGPVDHDAPASTLLSIAARLQTVAGVQGEAWPDKRLLRLPLQRHLRAPGGPYRFPLQLPDGQMIDAADPWAALARLREEWRPNTAAQLAEADNRLPKPTPEQPRRLHRSKVNPLNQASVIRWFTTNFTLADVFADIGETIPERSGGITCPWHDDKHPSLVFWTHYDGRQVCRCYSQHSGCEAAAPRFMDAFNVYCLIHKLTPAQAVARLAEEYNLGERRQMKIEAPETPAEASPVTTLDYHADLITKRREELEREAEAAADRRGEATVIKGVPGIGKTEITARLVNRLHAQGRRVAVIAPSKDHALLEWASRVPEAYVWRARHDICTCRPGEVTKALEELGYTVKCTDPDCPFQKQREELAGRVGIFQRNHLTLNGGELLRGAEVIVIDESPLDAILDESTATPGQLGGLLKRLGEQDPARPIVTALARLANKHDKGKDLYGPALIDALAEHVGDVAQAVAQGLKSSAARLHEVAREDADPKQLPKLFLGELLTALGHDAAPGPRNALVTWGRSSDARAYVWYHPRPMLGRVAGQLSKLAPAVVVLDGSADKAICERLYRPWPVRMVEIDAPLSPAVQLVQVTTGGSTRQIVADLGAKARAIALVCNHLDIVLDGGVTYKDATKALADELGGSWMHYQGQRGRNDLAQARTLAIVASPTAPPDAIERKARALWHDAQAITPTWERHGTAYYTATDPRLEAMNRIHGPEELRQAAHRIRPILAADPVTLLIFSPWPLAPLGLAPSVTITEMPHGNSSEGRAALDTYRKRRTLAGRGEANGQVYFLGQIQSGIRNEIVSPGLKTAQEIHLPPPYQPEGRALPVSLAGTALASVGPHRPRPLEPCPMCRHDAWYLRPSPPAWVCGHCHPLRPADAKAPALVEGSRIAG